MFCHLPSLDLAGSAAPSHGGTPPGTERDAREVRESDHQPDREGVATKNGSETAGSPWPPPTAAGPRSHLLAEGHLPQFPARKTDAAGETAQTASGYGSGTACDPSRPHAPGEQMGSATATGCGSASEATESVASGSVASVIAATASAATGNESAASGSAESATAESVTTATENETKASATQASETAATVTAATVTATRCQQQPIRAEAFAGAEGENGDHKGSGNANGCCASESASASASACGAHPSVESHPRPWAGPRGQQREVAPQVGALAGSCASVPPAGSRGSASVGRGHAGTTSGSAERRRHRRQGPCQDDHEPPS